MKHAFRSLTLLALVLSATPAFAQSLGAFQWQVQPVRQRAPDQSRNRAASTCSPASSCNAAAMPACQSTVGGTAGQRQRILGFTTINENGRGIHTRAIVNTSDFNGFTVTRREYQPALRVQPPAELGGPRTGPNVPNPEPQ